MSWDNYNQIPEANKKVFPEQFREVSRSSNYNPFPSESLAVYLKRLDSYREKLTNVAVQAHIYPKKGIPWYCHRQSGDCFICVLIQLVEMCISHVSCFPDIENWFFDHKLRLVYRGKSKSGKSRKDTS